MAVTQNSHSTNSGVTESTPLLKTTSASPISFRRGTLLDAPRIGLISAKTYYNSPSTNFLSPYREAYPSHYKRKAIQMNRKRMLSPRNFCVVATVREEPDRKEKIVGYAQFIRLGTDAGAKKQIQSKGLLWRFVLFILGWVFHFWWKIQDWFVGGEKHSNPEKLQMFYDWCVLDCEKYWKGRENRWHAQSVVVDPDYQRRGIGRVLMSEVTKKSEEECIPVGLESSGQGEKLYRAVGFDYLGKFQGDGAKYGLDEGGIMLYRPKGFTEEERDGEGEHVQI